MQVRPPAEVPIDATLVGALLREQHPDLAHLPARKAAEGWDNVIFRLGDDLAVRLPRRAGSAALIEQEQRWLPGLAARLPLPIPTPIRVGLAGSLFHWRWSIVQWLPGRSLLQARLRDSAKARQALEGFFLALHQPAPADAPPNPWRGVPLSARTTALRKHLRQVEPLVNGDAVRRFWDRVLAAPPWPGDPVWIHGDLHPGNLVVRRGQLSGIIDFGDLTSGDPATDLAVLWMLPAEIRAQFTGWAGDERGALERRARGWAVALGLAYLAHSRDDAAMGTLGQRTIAAALQGA